MKWGMSLFSSAELSENLRKLAHFRNLHVFVYWQVDDDILYTVIHTHLDNLRKYCEAVVRLL